ncbi:tyrosine-type recombinase/integrase [Candidatus Caldatribacterium saccharofermentans]|uniref:tyrosine-type recombinase/integrase n=1 Tax=Candidatus Caldatribacterium saccharofermentans TaxID=1454753 RepID=UPI003D04A46F
MGKVLKLAQPRGWKEHLEEFLLEKEVNGCRERTIEDYRYHLTRFFQGYEGDLEDFEALHKRCLEYLGGEIAPATYNIRRAYLSSFFNYLVSQGVLAQNPLKGMKRRKDDGKPRAIPLEVLQKLLELPDRRTFAGLRNYVLILLQIDTGIRPSEALHLLPRDFNLGGMEVTIPPGVAKTKASRTLPLSPVVVQWVRKLLSVRPREWGDEVPVFCSEWGKPLLETSWNYILRDYGRKLGYRITPYDLRHSFAILFLRNGGNVFALQRILGHTDLTMTKRYLALTQRDLREEHGKSTPLHTLVSKRVRKIKGR